MNRSLEGRGRRSRTRATPRQTTHGARTVFAALAFWFGAQCAVMEWPASAAPATALPDEVFDALEAMRERAAATSPPPCAQSCWRQRALLFKHNDAINAARLNGWISDAHYQAVQTDYARLNEQFAKSAAAEVGADFKVQESTSSTYSPGTDSDYITKVWDPEQVPKMQEAYNRRINEFLGEQHVLDEPRTDWHNRLDTDFMADPEYLAEQIGKEAAKEAFKKIAEMNNDAYKRANAAIYERVSRAKDGTTVTPELFRDYALEMRDFIEKKQRRLAELRQDPARLSDPKVKAEFHRLMAQEQKYISRIESANATLRAQEGLPDPPRDPGAPRFRVLEDADGNIVLDRVRQATNEPAHGTLAKRGSKRAPTRFGTTGAASAVAENSTYRALSGLSESMAEAARQNPEFRASAAVDIAQLTDSLPPAEKGALIERIKRQQGAVFAAEVAEAMREQYRPRSSEPGRSATGGGAHLLQEFDQQIARALGVSDDLSQMGSLRRRFNSSATKALGALSEIGVAAELYAIAQGLKVYYDNMIAATDPNTTDAEAEEYFRKAAQAAEAVEEATSLGVLFEQFPTVGAAYGAWVLGHEGGKWVLTNTETGLAFNRSAANLFDRIMQAGEDVAAKLTEYLGGESVGMQLDEQDRQLLDAYIRAIREGRLRLKDGYDSLDIWERIKEGRLLSIRRDLLEPGPGFTETDEIPQGPAVSITPSDPGRGPLDPGEGEPESEDQADRVARLLDALTAASTARETEVDRESGDATSNRGRPEAPPENETPTRGLPADAITLPAVRDLPIDEAIERLLPFQERHGIQFTIDESGVAENESGHDTVARLVPASQVLPGQAVSIVVRKYEQGGTDCSWSSEDGSAQSFAVESGKVPDVRGWHIRKAYAAVECAGFTPTIILGSEASPGARTPTREGEVEEVAPPPGWEAPPGAEVSLHVYTAPSVPGCIVPPIERLSVEKARERLARSEVPNAEQRPPGERECRLFLDVVEGDPAADATQAGTIYAQYPEPGVEVPQGTGVAGTVHQAPTTVVSTPPTGRSLAGIDPIPPGHPWEPEQFATDKFYTYRGGSIDRPPGGWPRRLHQGTGPGTRVYIRYGAGFLREAALVWQDPGDEAPDGVTFSCHPRERVLPGNPWDNRFWFELDSGRAYAKVRVVIHGYEADDFRRRDYDDALALAEHLLAQLEGVALQCD